MIARAPVVCRFFRVAVFLGTPCLLGAGVDFGGIRFQTPSGWQVEDRAELRDALDSHHGVLDVDSLVAVWCHETTTGVASRIVFGRRPHVLRVSPGEAPRARRLVEQAMRRSPGIRDFRIRGVEVTHVDGVPAYVIRLSFNEAGEPYEQLVYLVGGTETFVLAFSAPGSRYAEDLPAFRSLMDSVTFDGGTHAGHQAFFWLWGLLLVGVVSGLDFSGGLARGATAPSSSDDRPCAPERLR